VIFFFLCLSIFDQLLADWPGAGVNHRGTLPRSSENHKVAFVRCYSTTSLDSYSTSNTGTLAKNENQPSHLDAQGLPHMVDVSSKEITSRKATAKGTIRLNSLAFSLLIPDPPTEEQPFNDKKVENRPYQRAENSANQNFTADVTEIQHSKARHKSGSPSNILIVAQLAGIMAAKSTPALIPLCHPLPLTNISVGLKVIEKEKAVECTATVQCHGKTGVEMEALTAVSVALLTVWDMLKKVGGKEMVIEGIKVVEKSGGQSGEFKRTDS
jgi:molybdenum cofactor biosynthesis protein MoaC